MSFRSSGAAVGTSEIIPLPRSLGRGLIRSSAVLLSFARLARPGDTSFALIGTALGAGLAGSQLVTAWEVWWVAVSNACLSAGSMMINDWHDVGEDAINRPDRPIPSGWVDRTSALRAGVAVLTLGVIAAAMASAAFGALALGVLGGSILYTGKLKRVPVAGNALTALLSTYPLWCWMFVIRFPDPLYAGAVAGFFLGSAGREIIRTAADGAGDAALGIDTVTTRWGAHTALRAGVVLILLGIAVAFVAARGAGAVAYEAALALAGLSFPIAVVCLRPCPPATASRRFTLLARITTVGLALGATCDLVLGGWALR